MLTELSNEGQRHENVLRFLVEVTTYEQIIVSWQSSHYLFIYITTEYQIGNQQG